MNVLFRIQVLFRMFNDVCTSYNCYASVIKHNFYVVGILMKTDFFNKKTLLLILVLSLVVK